MCPLEMYPRVNLLEVICFKEKGMDAAEDGIDFGVAASRFNNASVIPEDEAVEASWAKCPMLASFL